jgi:hypothetical protein
LLVLVAILIATLRAPRRDRLRAAAIVWGGWLIITGLVISLSQGIIHEYYTVALAPAIGALIGIGGVWLWRERSGLWARVLLAAMTGVTAWWAWVLLERSSNFLPWLAPAVLIVGIGAAAGMLALPWLGTRGALMIAAAALIAGLAGPAAYAVNTATTAHEGSLPTAGPAVAGGRFGRGPGGAGGPGGFPTGGQPGGFPTGGQPGGFPPGGQPGGFPPGGPPGGFPPGGQPGGGPGGAGGLLNGSKPTAELTALLSANADQYTWVAATVGANRGAGYQLATGKPVLAVGGFNGSDPSPTLAEFQALVAAHRIHYAIAGGDGPGGGRGPGGPGSSGSAAEISTWVQAHFTPTTVGDVTVYDLTAPTSDTTS